MKRGGMTITPPEIVSARFVEIIERVGDGTKIRRVEHKKALSETKRKE